MVADTRAPSVVAPPASVSPRRAVGALAVAHFINDTYVYVLQAVLPALRAALPGTDLFYQETVHLTSRGHTVVAAALDRFIEEQGLLPR